MIYNSSGSSLYLNRRKTGRTLALLFCLLAFQCQGFGPTRANQPGQQGSEKGEAAATRTDSAATGSINGRVVGDDGQPLAYVRVYLVSRKGAEGERRAAATEKDGRFHFRNVEADVYSIETYLPSYFSESDLAYDSGGRDYYRIGDTATIRMFKGGVITGKVTTIGGEPVIDARVAAIRVRDGDGRPALGGNLIGADGGRVLQTTPPHAGSLRYKHRTGIGGTCHSSGVSYKTDRRFLKMCRISLRP